MKGINLVILIVANLCFSNAMAKVSESDANYALKTAMDIVAKAKKISKYQNVLDPEEANNKKFGAYCALSTLVIDLTDTANLVFGSYYTNSANEKQQKRMVELLRNKLANLFNSQLDAALGLKFDWGTARAEFSNDFRRSRRRVPGFNVSVGVQNPFKNSTIDLELNLVSKADSENDLALIDLKLGSFKVSKNFKGYVDNLGFGETVDTVLNKWESSDPHCPENLKPYFELFL